VCIAIATPVLAFAAKNTHGVVVRKRTKGAAIASCPRGEHVAFGGLVAQYQLPAGSGAEVFPEGMRRSADDKWTVYGMSGTDLTGSRLTAAAYCERGPVPRAATKTVPLPALQVASATATCPAGTVVVGGGYNSAASAQHIELVGRLQRSSSTQWVVTMINIMPKATTLTAIAYCSAGSAPKQVTKAVSLAPHKGGTARASCPKGTTLAFGGVLGDEFQAGTKFGAVAPFSWTASTTTQWVVTGYNAGNVAGKLTALAYCR
jgi:hypothetical protein